MNSIRCCPRLSTSTPRHKGADTLRNLRQWVSRAQGNPVLPDDWQAINVHDAIHHVWQLLRMPQQFPAVTLHTQVSKALTLTLPSVLLEQVLANLVLNAACAGATTVWFSALHKDGGVSIQVQDNAGGIDEGSCIRRFSRL